MSGSEDYAKEPLERVLWGGDWGTSQVDLTEEEATNRGLVLLRGRWVPESDYARLNDLLSATRSIRLASTIWTSLVLVFWIIVLVPYFISYGSRGIDPLLCGALVAILSIHFVSGVALRSYHRWAWYVVSASLALSAVASIGFGVLLLAVSRSTAGVLPIVVFAFWAPGALFVYLLSRLMKREVRALFEKERLSLIHELRPVSRFGTGYRLLGVGILIFLNVILDLHYYDWYHGRPYSNSACDRAASVNIGRLAASIERLQNEMVDGNCPADAANVLKNGFDLQYLVGPYYGWTGTTQKCQILVRVVGNEVWGCALRGSHPSPNHDLRYIYRAPIAGGRDLPATMGPCQGKAYGGPEDNCYTTTMLAPDCTFHRPDASKKCKEVKDW